jgi:lactoylglutathione lyase
MAMITEMHTVAVVVSNRSKAAEWYKEKLGFAVREEDYHWTAVWPLGQCTGLHLCEMTPLEPGNTGIIFLSDDLQKSVDQLKSKGVEFTQELKKESWGTYAMFKDPDGNEFWLMPKNDLSAHKERKQ